jgi:hypothetical protein
MGVEVRLGEPGAGVPFWERWAGKYLLLPRFRRMGWTAAVAAFEREGRALLGSARGVEASRLERKTLVARLPGLEDSSRHWSYAMVVEHLAIVGERTEAIVGLLSRGERPTTEVRTADLKPPATTPAADAMATYAAFLDGIGERIRAHHARGPSRALFPHPWFGPLDAVDWTCFLPMHQRIHVEQARRILATSGTVAAQRSPAGEERA